MAKGCIYVDDAGNPGSESGSDFLSSSRKSWTAVIVPSSVASSLETGMAIFLKGIREEFGASELHFTDVYSGRGVWKNIEINKRIEIFNLMNDILEQFSLPIIHQTVSEESFHEHERVLSRLEKSPNSRWDIKNISHFGFLLLCSSLSKYISELYRQGAKDFILPMPLIVDEGIAKAGASIDLPNWGSVIEGQKAFFTTSKESPGIQVADFAAFIISRTQWIMAKQKKDAPIKRGDLEFLKMTTNLNIVNIPMLPFWINNISKEIYEDALLEDRILKKLPPLNS